MSNHQILNSSDHLTLRIHTETSLDLGDNVMACLAVPLEFRQIQGEFPIVFRRDVEHGSFAAMALFGFENGENLFVENGQWAARYRPLALSTPPFLVGRPASDEGEAQVHIDMEHRRISSNGEGMRVFDDDGKPTPYLEDMASRLGALHDGYENSGAFFAALGRHGLLEPFTLEVPLRDGSKHSLVGFHTIDEEKLRALDGDALADLHADGHLLPIFMAVASLAQFSELVARKNARVADA
jgi:hypothetical protein